MKGIRKKLALIDRLQDQLDAHIWKIFSMYIKENGILFNSPDGWRIEGSSIYFYGSDGCMGCYDPMSLYIPFKFFENPDEEFESLRLKRQQEKEEKEKQKKQQEKERELKELQRLQEKYNA